MWLRSSSKEGVRLGVSALSFDHLCRAIFESEWPREEDWWTGTEQCVQVLVKLLERWLSGAAFAPDLSHQRVGQGVSKVRRRRYLEGILDGWQESF